MDKVITERSHPRLFIACELISHDRGSGAGHTNYAIPEPWAGQVDEVERALDQLTDEELETVAIGEESEADELISCESVAGKFLTAFFDDFEIDVVALCGVEHSETHDSSVGPPGSRRTHLIQTGNYTPTEVREAAMLAQLKFEEIRIRRFDLRDIDDIRRAILATSREFRPFAVFDEQLDCIRVITRDCSFTEVRVDRFLTVLEANYPLSGQVEYVGFTIKGIAHLCETHNIPRTGPWKLADFLDAILADGRATPAAGCGAHRRLRPTSPPSEDPGTGG